MKNEQKEYNQGSFVVGNIDTGICIASWDNQQYNFAVDNKQIQVNQLCSRSDSGHMSLELTFKLAEPVRFSLEIMIPEEAVNACVLLNGQVLIMPMTSDWPDNMPVLDFSACQQQGEAISTLRPGTFQKINFRWHDGDKLICYCIV